MDQSKVISSKMYSGLALEIEDDNVIMLTENSELMRIKFKKGIHVGDQVYFFDEDICSIKNHVEGSDRLRVVRSIKLIVAAALFICAILFGQSHSLETAAVLSMDINPSIEFELDARGYIKRVVYLNDEAKTLVREDEALEHLYLEVLKNMIVAAKDLGYVSDKHDILIGIAPLNDQGQRLVSKIKDDLSLMASNGEIGIAVSHQYETYEMRKGSLGRALLSDQYKNLSEYEVEHLSIKDIYKKIDPHSEKMNWVIEIDENSSEDIKEDPEEIESTETQNEINSTEDHQKDDLESEDERENDEDVEELDELETDEFEVDDHD